eukprot:scaffold523_cov171-Ochromonas_danica.AAC.2
MESMHEAGLEDGVYFAPLEASLQTRRLLFGLHGNAAITFQQKESRFLVSSIVLCSGHYSGGGGGKSSEGEDEKVIEQAALNWRLCTTRSYFRRCRLFGNLFGLHAQVAREGTSHTLLAPWVLLSPAGFMTAAVKQTCSREVRLAVDTLKIGCEMTGLEAREVKSAPPTGAYVYGLFMEGGRFNRATLMLEDSMPRQLLDQVSCIWLKPVVAADYRPTGLRIHQIDWPHQRHEVVFRRTWTCFSTCSSFTKSNLSARTANRVDFVKLLPPSASIVTACPPGAVDWRKKAKETWEE